MQQDEMMEYYEQEQPLNIKEFIFRLLSKWYWFAICGFLGLSMAWVHNRYTISTWQVESTVLVSEGSKSTGVDNLFESLNLMKTVNMDNQIGLLKSYNLNRQAIENLGWSTSWFVQGSFVDHEFYDDEPFIVSEPPGVKNYTGIPIYITATSADEFMVKYEFEGIKNGEKTKIDFHQEGKVGVPFISPEFQFTLNKGKSDPKPGETYYFRFNDLNDMALNYRSKLSVDLTTKTAEIMRLTVRGSQPAREVAFLNELGKVYIQFGLHEKNRTSENTVLFIDAQLTGLSDSLRIAGQSVTDFRSQKQIFNLSQEGGLVMSRLENLESQKAMSEMQLDYYKNLRSYINSANGMKKAVAPSVIGITDPSLNSMVMKLAELYSQREVLTYSASDLNPAVVMIDKELQSTRNSLAENLTNLQTNVENNLQTMKKRIAEVNRSAEQLPGTEQQLINIKRRFDVNNDLYTFLLTKRAEAAITRASNVADSQVIDQAQLKTATVVGPNTRLNLMIGLMLGLGIPLIVILLSDFFNDTIKSREEVERATSLPIVGSIGHNHYDKEIVVTEYPRSAITESFRSLRTNLQYILTDTQHHVIGVHSAIPGEGKTFLSVNLAHVIAMNDKKVLLIAVDMHKPRLNEIFDLDNKKPGLSTFLSRRDEFNDIVNPTKIENISFIGSGLIPPNPAELLENGRFKDLIEEAKEHFDYIVLDNPPVLMVTDGLISGRLCNTNLFTIRQGYSKKDQIKLIDQLAANQTLPKIGLILNDMETSHYGYGHYGNYYGKDNCYSGRTYGSGYYDDQPKPNGWEKVIRRINKILKR